MARSGIAAAIVRAGVLLAIVDGLWACALTLLYGSTITRVWQGVAATLMGQSAFSGGTRAAFIGVLMHIGVAFGWSTVFVLLVMRRDVVRRVLASRFGLFKVAAVYGPLMWVVMSLVVITTLTGRKPNITARWFIQLAGHFVFVGIPIVVGATGRWRPRVGD